MKRSLFLKSTLALALASPFLASAESQRQTGSADAQARLDLQVIVPRVVFLAVGTSGAGLADNATVDTLSFDFSGSPQDVGNGTATPSQGVAVRVFGNDGQITLSTDAGVTDLVAGGGETIPLTQITVTSSDSANLPAPAFGGGTATVLASSGRVTNRSATWNYAYENDTAPASGTYSATVTYTAALP